MISMNYIGQLLMRFEILVLFIYHNITYRIVKLFDYLKKNIFE